MIALEQTPSSAAESYNKLIDKINATPLLIAPAKEVVGSTWYDNYLKTRVELTQFSDNGESVVEKPIQSRVLEGILKSRIELISRKYSRKAVTVEEQSRIEILNNKLDEFDEKFRVDQLEKIVKANSKLEKTVQKMNRISEKYK